MLTGPERGLAGKTPTRAYAHPFNPPPPPSLSPNPALGSLEGLPSLERPNRQTCGVHVGAEGAWEVEALPGPNAEPDYFTAEDIATFYSSTYKVHYNS